MQPTIEIERGAIYQLREAAKLCGLPSSTLETATKRGDLIATKRGRRIFIEGDALWRWITGRPQQNDGGRDA